MTFLLDSMFAGAPDSFRREGLWALDANDRTVVDRIARTEQTVKLIVQQIRSHHQK
jgi:hypothetical protein